ncbi:MAG: hypothetical protein ACP5H5_03605 [Pyrobaculum sp.]
MLRTYFVGLVLALAAALVFVTAPKFSAMPLLSLLGGEVLKEPWGYIKISTSGDEDEISITVFENGRPSNRDYAFAVVGPVGGPKSGAAVRGKGSVKLGPYYAELAKIAAEHGYKPKDVEFGLMIDLLRETEHNETHIAVERMLISIPLRPERPNKIEVSVEFKPQIVTYRKKDGSQATSQTQKQQLQSTPPPIIKSPSCPQYPQPGFSYLCIEWVLVSSQALTNQLIPTAVAYLTNYDTLYSGSVEVYSRIEVDQNTGLKITLPLGGIPLSKGKYYLFNYGFSVTLSSSTQLMSLGCTFTPDSSPISPSCVDLLRRNQFATPPRYSRGSVASLGVGASGTVWVVTYEIWWVVYEWNGRDWTRQPRYKEDTVYGLWAVPYAESKGDGIYWWYPKAAVNTPDIEYISALFNTQDYPISRFTVDSGCGVSIKYDNYYVVAKGGGLSAQPFLSLLGGLACAAGHCYLLAVATSFDVTYETSKYISGIYYVSVSYTRPVYYETRGMGIRTFLESVGVEAYVPALFIRPGAYNVC